MCIYWKSLKWLKYPEDNQTMALNLLLVLDLNYEKCYDFTIYQKEVLKVVGFMRVETFHYY